MKQRERQIDLKKKEHKKKEKEEQIQRGERHRAKATGERERWPNLYTYIYIDEQSSFTYFAADVTHNASCGLFSASRTKRYIRYI